MHEKDFPFSLIKVIPSDNLDWHEIRDTQGSYIKIKLFHKFILLFFVCLTIGCCFIYSFIWNMIPECFLTLHLPSLLVPTPFINPPYHLKNSCSYEVWPWNFESYLKHLQNVLEVSKFLNFKIIGAITTKLWWGGAHAPLPPSLTVKKNHDK